MENIKIVAKNRKALHNYFVEDKLEVGIVLTGTEVKAIRQGKLNLKDSYASVENGEVYIANMHISPYEQGNIFNVDPVRKRKLLLHKREIVKLADAVKQKGYSLVPLTVYFKNGKVKLEIATAKGKKNYDKRQSIAERDAERRIRQQKSEKYAI